MSKKLTELPEATVINPTDELYVVQGGVSKRVPSSLVGGVSAYWVWNEIDLSQINTTPIARAPGTDGVLSVDVFANSEQPAIRHTHTAGSSGGFVLYELLDAEGNRLVVPERYTIRSRMGARTPGAPSGDGANSIPDLVPYILDDEHFFWMFRNGSATDELLLFCCNGENTFASSATVGWRHSTAAPVLGPNTDGGQVMIIDVISRALSPTDDPAMEFHFQSFHDPAGPSNFGINLASGTWTASGGSNDPDTAWDSGWNVADAEIGVGIMFTEVAGSAGYSQMGELAVLPYGADAFTAP